MSLIYPARKGGFLSEAFEISDMLLEDKDDIVQKGYGLLLKEASRKHQKEVFNYVQKTRRGCREQLYATPSNICRKNLKQKQSSGIDGAVEFWRNKTYFVGFKRLCSAKLALSRFYILNLWLTKK